MNTMFHIIIFLAITVLKTSNAAVSILPHVKTPPEFRDQKGCYVPALKRVLEYNKPYSPTDACVEYICQATNETYLYTCGKLAVPDGCRINKGEKHLPFNKCCDTILCGAKSLFLHG